MLNEKCKMCGKEVGGTHTEVIESREFVIVDEETERAIILNKEDCLCDICSQEAVYYRRIKC